jgi:hypothetical protein
MASQRINRSNRAPAFTRSAPAEVRMKEAANGGGLYFNFKFRMIPAKPSIKFLRLRSSLAIDSAINFSSSPSVRAAGGGGIFS